MSIHTLLGKTGKDGDVNHMIGLSIKRMLSTQKDEVSGLGFLFAFFAELFFHFHVLLWVRQRQRAGQEIKDFLENWSVVRSPWSYFKGNQKRTIKNY
jgi:hypothetical protein